ncbi:phosphate butyryltransferase [bacterium]|nr:phosphate butyryltransferase [bacterium]MBU4602280.1 phosphate butyryltransferase [bacterium]
MSIRNFKELKEAVMKLKPMKVVVAAAEDERVIGGIKLAKELGIVKFPILTGELKKITEIIQSLGEDINEYDIREASDATEAARLAVSTINNNEAQILVKGRLETVYYLKAILDKENGIRASEVLSNLTMFEMESYHKFIAVTDNAIIPFPTLLEKKVIIENTKPLWTSLGIDKPKVAVLAAIELVNPKMDATVDAACLAKMAERGQIKGFSVDGPLSYDIAISLTCAQGKHITDSLVAGDPDLLLLPNLEAANILGKSYKFHGKAESGGLILGAKVPVVLNSRSDSAERRLNSMLMARAIAEGRILV